MFLTQDQNYLLFILGQTKCMRTSQASRLLGLLDETKKEPYCKSALRKLRHMGKIRILEDGLITMPSRSVDNEMLEAVDIMLDMTEGKVLAISAEKPPFKLCFLTEVENSIGNFAVMFVRKGRERLTEALPPETIHKTVIFLLSDMSRKSLIHYPSDHYFAVSDGSSTYRYFKGQ